MMRILMLAETGGMWKQFRNSNHFNSINVKVKSRIAIHNFLAFYYFVSPIFQNCYSFNYNIGTI